ncbi:hypothetical protein B9Z19DRAFT_290114 [Tuber borchii]|uniref:Uncharacterized protein n=1 Tax=Tuber borchii TaxID=42251 RepID=A0A2T6ZKJ2_TUBBO|nr:hypothetical protein B9Z19DRAFT_290114 [Tuber borchii]
MIPQYAYDDESTIYLRRTARLPTTSSTAKGDTIGHVYKFHTSESMFDFQKALTSERVYQHLVKRVASVKFKRSSENGTHSYHDVCLQLWHENPPADALFTDVASGGSGSFLTCFLTDDITLEHEDHDLKLMLVPTKYGGYSWKSPKPWKSPKTVKAAIRGSESRKGGFRLDKDKISPDDQDSFENFSYIHINFRDLEYLNKFKKLWNKMMAMRRTERERISGVRDKLKEAIRAPLAVN